MKIYVLRDIKILEEEKERIKHQMLEKYRQIYVMQETFGENITKFIMRSRVIKVIFENRWLILKICLYDIKWKFNNKSYYLALTYRPVNLIDYLTIYLKNAFESSVSMKIRIYIYINYFWMTFYESINCSILKPFQKSWSRISLFFSCSIYKWCFLFILFLYFFHLIYLWFKNTNI